MSYIESARVPDASLPRRTLIYGRHGVGKTTWASRWPTPIILPTEDGANHVSCAVGPVIRTSEGLARAIEDVVASDFETIVIDSIDWAEKIIQEELDASDFDQSYGRGIVELGHRVAQILSALDKARASGQHVVLVGHAKAISITRPDGLTYQTYSVKLTRAVGDIVLEWCDEVLYCQRDFRVRQTEKGKPGVGVDTGATSVYTSLTPYWEAKHRLPGLPEKFDLSDIESYLSYVEVQNAVEH